MIERVRSSRNLPVKSNRGGAREGAGGGPKRVEIRSLKNEVLHLRMKYKKMPLNHLLDILNTDPPPPPERPHELQEQDEERTQEDYDEELKAYERDLAEYRTNLKAFEARQDWASEKAAPFMHHRLSAIEITGEGGGPIHQKVDIRKLSEAELDALERLVRKAAIVTLDEDQFHEVD
jgi:hypothetical protein